MLTRAVIASLAIASAILPAAAQDFPKSNITMVVPFAAGGPTDIVARIVGEHMSKTLGKPVIIENVVGAGGTTGSIRAMRAQNDGHTIIMGHMGTHAAAVSLYPNLAYKPDVDFEAIGMAAGTPILIVTRKDIPAKDLKEFVVWAKTNNEKTNMAHAGVGSVSFTTCLLLNSILQTKPTQIPFNGTGPALNALVGSQVDYMCDQVVNLVPHVTGGTIKALAVGTEERNPALPDVPTSKEAGLPAFKVTAWNAVFAPKGTPQPVVDKLADALDKALDDPAVRKRLLDLGSDIPDKKGRGPTALSTLVKSEIERWAPVLKGTTIN
ncbi:MAG TPA: tripartite tricarboxylate transporter substrate-binding protein [Pseudolabrys sp.]